MADVAQLVRALVCGTRCREFESHLPPHFKSPYFQGLLMFNNQFTSHPVEVQVRDIFSSITCVAPTGQLDAQSFPLHPKGQGLSGS